MRTLVVTCVMLGIVGFWSTTQAPAQLGDIGERIEQGAERISAEIERGWARARRTVDDMSVQARVYSRLHWDKALQDATLGIEVRDDVVVLSGSVASEAAKRKAVQLTEDTIGVKRVVDELAIAERRPQQ